MKFAVLKWAVTLPYISLLDWNFDSNKSLFLAQNRLLAKLNCQGVFFCKKIKKVLFLAKILIYAKKFEVWLWSNLGILVSFNKLQQLKAGLLVRAFTVLTPGLLQKNVKKV